MAQLMKATPQPAFAFGCGVGGNSSARNGSSTARFKMSPKSGDHCARGMTTLIVLAFFWLGIYITLACFTLELEKIQRGGQPPRLDEPQDILLPNGTAINYRTQRDCAINRLTVRPALIAKGIFALLWWVLGPGNFGD